MFTGIVEEVGEIVEVQDAVDVQDAVEEQSASGGTRLCIAGPTVTEDARPGESIAVNGACLTVVTVEPPRFTVDVVRETLERSSLAGACSGHRVNLERAAALGARLGGHIVQGHIDGAGRYLGRDPAGVARFAAPGLGRYLVDKGSVAVDGVSLTVAATSGDEFTVALIPTTLRETVLGHNAPGDPVNIEVDVLAKYVEKLTAPARGQSETAPGAAWAPAPGDNGGQP